MPARSKCRRWVRSGVWACEVAILVEVREGDKAGISGRFGDSSPVAYRVVRQMFAAVPGSLRQLFAVRALGTIRAVSPASRLLAGLQKLLRRLLLRLRISVSSSAGASIRRIGEQRNLSCIRIWSVPAGALDRVRPINAFLAERTQCRLEVRRQGALSRTK